MFQEQELQLKKPCSDLPLLPILICFQIQTVVSWVQPMPLQWVFLLYSEVVNLESSESHPDVTAGFQTKKEQAEWDPQPI